MSNKKLFRLNTKLIFCMCFCYTTYKAGIENDRYLFETLRQQWIQIATTFEMTVKNSEQILFKELRSCVVGLSGNTN